MAKTFAELKSYLKFQFGNRTDLESVDSENMYGVWINMAYQNLTTRNRFWSLNRNFKFPELRDTDTSQTTTDGTAYVNVPSGAVVIYNVLDTTIIIVFQIGLTQMQRASQHSTHAMGTIFIYTRHLMMSMP